MSELCVLVLSTRNGAYQCFKNSIRATWMKAFRDRQVACYFYEGGYGRDAIEGDTIQLRCDDSLQGTAAKLSRALRLLRAQTGLPDLVYRTNLSSFIDVVPFFRFFNGIKDKCDVYSGVIGKARYFPECLFRHKLAYSAFRRVGLGRTILFASGSGFFLSGRYAESLCSIDRRYEKFVDDVMVAVALGIRPALSLVPLRMDIALDYSHQVDAVVYQRQVEKQNLFHYRVKTANRLFDAALIARMADPSFRRILCVRPVS